MVAANSKRSHASFYLDFWLIHIKKSIAMKNKGKLDVDRMPKVEGQKRISL